MQGALFKQLGMDGGYSAEQIARAALLAARMASGLLALLVRPGLLQQLPLAGALQGRGLVEGNQ